MKAMVQLEYFTQADFPQLMQWVTNEELLIKRSGSTFKFPLTEEDLNWYIKDANDPDTSKMSMLEDEWRTITASKSGADISHHP